MVTLGVMKIVVHIERQVTGIRFSSDRLKRLVRFVCRRFQVSNAIINIRVVDDYQIRRMNRKFLKSWRNTDCLSFDLSEGRACSKRLFCFVLNGSMAARQAKKRGHSQESELALYMVHCLLHNLGFDDRTSQQAVKMHKIEDNILQQYGYGLVYGKPVR